MSDLVIVDTDILIDVSHKDDKAVNYVENLEANYSLAISLITQMELIVGCRNKHELAILDKFLNRFQVIKLNESISTIAIDLLKQYRLFINARRFNCFICIVFRYKFSDKKST